MLCQSSSQESCAYENDVKRLTHNSEATSEETPEMQMSVVDSKTINNKEFSHKNSQTKVKQNNIQYTHFHLKIK